MKVGDLILELIVEGGEASARLKKFRQEEKKTEKNTKRLEKSTKKFGKTLKKLTLTFGGIYGAYRLLNTTIRKAITASNAQEEAESRLVASLKNHGQATRENISALKDLAAQRQKVTKFGDEETISAMALLSTFDLQVDTIKKLTPLMQDVATMTAKASGGQADLEQAAKLVGLAMEGQAGRLKQAGISVRNYEEELKAATTDSEKAALIMKILEENAGGMAETVGKTDSAAFRQLTNAVGDNLEVFGSWIKKVSGPFARALTQVVSLEKEHSENLEQNRMEINSLVTAIMSANEDQKTRNRLIKELQDKYPDFLKNIEDEALNNETLSERLKEVNKQMLNKIILSRADEKRDKVIRKQADAYETMYEKQKILARFVSEKSEEYGIDLDKDADIMEKYSTIMKKRIELSRGGQRPRDWLGIQNVAVAYKNAQERYNELSEKAKQLLKEKQQIAKKLGVELTNNKITQKESKENQNDSKDSAEERNEAEIEYKRLLLQEKPLEEQISKLKEKRAKITGNSYEAKLKRKQLTIQINSIEGQINQKAQKEQEIRNKINRIRAKNQGKAELIAYWEKRLTELNKDNIQDLLQIEVVKERIRKLQQEQKEEQEELTEKQKNAISVGNSIADAMDDALVMQWQRGESAVENWGETVIQTFERVAAAFLTRSAIWLGMQALGLSTGGFSNFVLNPLISSFDTGGWTGPGSNSDIAGLVHKNEVVFESGITDKNIGDLLNLRAGLQQGYSIQDMMQPVVNFSPGGSDMSTVEQLLGVIANKSMSANVNINSAMDYQRFYEDRIVPAKENYNRKKLT